MNILPLNTYKYQTPVFGAKKSKKEEKEAKETKKSEDADK